MHRQFASVVQGFGEDFELVAARPPPTLVADVVDRGFEHEPERLVAGVFDE
jgi:hypothetical protein